MLAACTSIYGRVATRPSGAARPARSSGLVLKRYGVRMAQSRRAWLDVLAAVFAASLAWACSSARSGGSNDSNQSGASSGGSTENSASTGGVGFTTPSTGGTSDALASAGNAPASASAGASGVRRIFYLDVQGSVRVFDE